MLAHATLVTLYFASWLYATSLTSVKRPDPRVLESLPGSKNENLHSPPPSDSSALAPRSRIAELFCDTSQTAKLQETLHEVGRWARLALRSTSVDWNNPDDMREIYSSFRIHKDPTWSFDADGARMNPYQRANWYVQLHERRRLDHVRYVYRSIEQEVSKVQSGNILLSCLPVPDDCRRVFPKPFFVSMQSGLIEVVHSQPAPPSPKEATIDFSPIV
ncbi:MAG: hypothetical protein Q9160_008510 [Pyrenula sp. 1 TL-2023]